MTNPTNHSKRWALGLIVLMLLLAACVRPVVTEDPTATPEGVATQAPLTPPTAVPDFLPSPTPEVLPTAVPEQATAVPQPDVPAAGTTYVVVPGDTLFSISQQTGVPAEEIMAANNMTDPNQLVVGQQLIIPAAGSAVPPPAGGTGTVHTVRAGENLFRIGLQYGCTVDQMSQANNIVYPYTIFPGQQIVVPAC
jgi:LysM repeat protein